MEGGIAIAPSIVSSKSACALAAGVSSHSSTRLSLVKLTPRCDHFQVFKQRFLCSPALQVKQGGHWKISTLTPLFVHAGGVQSCCQAELVSQLPLEPDQSEQEALLVSEIGNLAGVEPQPPLLQMHTSTSGVRGLAVCSGVSVKAGQLLLSMPMTSVLYVPKEVKGGQLDGRGPNNGRGACGDAACRLAVKLLVELQQPSSVWQQYAQLLPTEYENVAEWDPEELAELQSEAVVGAVIAANAQWQEQATLIQRDANIQLGIPHVGFNSATHGSRPSLVAPTANAPAPAVPLEIRHAAAKHTSINPINTRMEEGPSALVDAPLSAASASPPPFWQPPFSERAAFWALRTVLTRAFSATVEGLPVQSLVPVVDLLNHAPPGRPLQGNPSPLRQRSHLTPDLGFGQWRIHSFQGTPPSAACFQVFASAPLAAGQEATISYGPHTNLEFLVSYGFVPETNPADSVILYHSVQAVLDDVDAPVKLERHKAELLCGLMGRTRTFSADADGTAPTLLESLYVLHACDAAELSGLETAWQRSKSLTSAHISRETRAAAGRQVVQRCTELLAGHETSLEEDKKRKEELDGDLAGRGRRLHMALSFRIARKEILTRTRRRYAALAEMICF